MNKISKFFFLLSIALSFMACTKNDDPKTVPLRDYTEQYTIDAALMEEYLDTHFITVDANYNVAIDTILPATTQLSIRQQTAFPIQFKMVNSNGVDYKVYYLKLREGVNERPTAVDSIHVSYRGTLAANRDQFDYAPNPLWFELETVIQAWSEIIPLFKTGFYDNVEGPNPVNFTDYGAGVMFVPSGLGYFGNAPASGAIPVYSNLVFSFKLFELQYKDHDRDGIFSKDEVAAAGDNPLDYDSDSDGFANMYDLDDDGDLYLTRDELKRPAVLGQPTAYYSFNGAAVDDVATPYDDTQGIPSCSGDFNTATRLRKHLDPNCH